MTLPKNWEIFLENHWTTEQHLKLMEKVKEQYAQSQVYPPEKLLFRAFELCGPQDVKALIIGQDPYHGPYQANGLAFSVPSGIKLPPSLRNIYKEIIRDYGDVNDAKGDLSAWARQGVLLLNSTLTVEAGRAGSHAKLGWQWFTDAVIKCLAHRSEHLVFLLWGKHAQQKSEYIDASRHLVLESVHPSPLSAHRGFIGNNHFSACNAYLKANNKVEIQW